MRCAAMPLMRGVERLPHPPRRRRHVDVAHAGAAVERVDDGVDDRRRRADGAGLAGAFDAERIGRAGTLWVENAKFGRSPARGMA